MEGLEFAELEQKVEYVKSGEPTEVIGVMITVYIVVSSST